MNAHRNDGSATDRNDYRRGERKFDRRTGTGRTASQYENHDRYNGKHDAYNDRYDDRPSYGNNRWQNQHHNGEHESSKHNGRNNRDKRNSDQNYGGKRAEDSKPNRNFKSTPKFDASNYSQREKLIREIDAGKLECLVCCEMIKPFQSTWSCANCYHIIHLKCIITWAASSKSDEGWRCCACQNISKRVPHEYFCFCGKMKNPQYNRNDVAHSCGDVCERSEGCDHRCTQLCHPGEFRKC